MKKRRWFMAMSAVLFPAVAFAAGTRTEKESFANIGLRNFSTLSPAKREAVSREIMLPGFSTLSSAQDLAGRVALLNGAMQSWFWLQSLDSGDPGVNNPGFGEERFGRAVVSRKSGLFVIRQGFEPDSNSNYLEIAAPDPIQAKTYSVQGAGLVGEENPKLISTLNNAQTMGLAHKLADQLQRDLSAKFRTNVYVPFIESQRCISASCSTYP